MKKLFRILIPSLLITVMLVLSACGGNDTPAADATAGTGATAPATATATALPEDISERTDYKAQMWNAVEIPFMSLGTYKDPVSEVELDVIFTSPSGKEYKMPGFWDGEDNWKVRFAPNEYGVWNYKTVCTNASDNGLNGKTGTVACNAYKGDLEIYKHGFVTTSYGHKYFTYADGTPFFYLGDTHWAMYAESFDKKDGYNASDKPHFQTIVDLRVEQGFTVYQSEPISSPFNLADGTLNKTDVKGFQKADKYYQYIAQSGLVHANAEFFFSSDMSANLMKNETFLRNISRYWVARFGAYPVMWTMAQEVDNDFYFERGDQKVYSFLNNPWVKVAEFIREFDPYKHPLTAHQENTGTTTVTGAGTGGKASGAGRSAFLNCEAHDWWGAQWSPSLTGSPNFTVAKDYWESPQIAVDYEGRYCYLWTKNFGSRAQGWIAYLNGMYGYGYGAQDIWCYNNSYNTDVDSNDGVDTITSEEKKTMKWYKAMFLESAYQTTYMRYFFSQLEWWKLVPNFNNGGFFSPSKNSAYSIAHDGNNTYVGYFYGANTVTGILMEMDASATYTAKWFNPSTCQYTDIASDIKTEERAGSNVWSIPEKPDKADWVLLVTKN